MASLLDFPPLTVLPETSGIYVSLLITGEIKIGASADIATRHKSQGYEHARILAVLPGWRGVEADLHARFRAFRSRREGQAMFRETYHPVQELHDFVVEMRARGFTAEDLRAGIWRGAEHPLLFDNGEELILAVTYAPLTEPGSFFPRYIMERVCFSCGQSRNSLQFINEFTIESGRRSAREYLVLHSTETCALCLPKVFPAATAFPEGQTSMRLGKIRSRAGDLIRAYDRDRKVWLDLCEFGVRRMAKRMRIGARNDVYTLRLQPSGWRHGQAQGHAPFAGSRP